jgi:hypothetical protein
MEVFDLIAIALAVSAASITVSKTAITERFRKWLWTKKAFKTVAYLADCPYCQAHWYAAVLIAMMAPWEGVFTFLVQVGAVIAMSAIATGYILKLLIWDQREIDSLREKLDEAIETISELIEEK